MGRGGQTGELLATLNARSSRADTDSAAAILYGDFSSRPQEDFWERENVKAIEDQLSGLALMRSSDVGDAVANLEQLFTVARTFCQADEDGQLAEKYLGKKPSEREMYALATRINVRYAPKRQSQFIRNIIPQIENVAWFTRPFVAFGQSKSDRRRDEAVAEIFKQFGLEDRTELEARVLEYIQTLEACLWVRAYPACA
jgi:hypothetical protein